VQKRSFVTDPHTGRKQTGRPQEKGEGRREKEAYRDAKCGVAPPPAGRGCVAPPPPETISLAFLVVSLPLFPDVGVVVVGHHLFCLCNFSASAFQLAVQFHSWPDATFATLVRHLTLPASIWLLQSELSVLRVRPGTHVTYRMIVNVQNHVALCYLPLRPPNGDAVFKKLFTQLAHPGRRRPMILLLLLQVGGGSCLPSRGWLWDLLFQGTCCASGRIQQAGAQWSRGRNQLRPLCL